MFLSVLDFLAAIVSVVKGIAQRELARLLKRDKVTVNRWINGNRGITLNNLEAIAKAIKVKPEKLISSELKVIHKIVIK